MTNGHIGWTLPVDKPLLGSLRSDHDNGSKDVAKLKKTEFASFQTLSRLSGSAKLSKVGGFSWS